MSPSRPLPFSRGARTPRDADETTVPSHARPRQRRLRGVFTRPVELAERIEHATALDDAAIALSRVVRKTLRRSGTADALHGVPLGQPAHPPLVRVPIGCWASATLLDLLPGTSKASGALIAAGIAGTVPAAAAGLADWSTLHREQQRVGLVHAASGATATALFSASLLARAAGYQRSGKLLSLGGLTVAGAGGYLGGHLAFRLGAGASHAEPVAHLAPLGWHDLCRVRDLPDGRPVRKTLGYLSLLVLRQGTEVKALADHCAHLGGPLHQGRLAGEGDDVCIVCPWHGSTFRMTDGTVVHGPATARQPAFDTQITPSGMLQVKPKT
ncbi:MAG TPA: Rieske 2Fe-2S domain-containing protein [Streptosporangiaceae bacterium]|nr:Rieske 2Fe-2S domain-containing protein [Streptosporangiaceae bacterium]